MKNNSFNDKAIQFFFEISRIPRGSGNEKGISDFMVNWANERNLKVHQDEKNNIIIWKKATKGYENSPGVILQGHLDMVCEKNEGKEHDFLKDPIETKIVGDMIYASDTTLGADNGIAIAYIMTILDDNSIEHPDIEAVLTVEEETGLGGAEFIDGSLLKNRIMINLDAEPEGVFVVSSAGGNRTVLSYKYENEKEIITDDLEFCSISVNGLNGGHSGVDIDKGRGNANILIARVLDGLRKKYDIRIISINGGMKTNAIPREATVELAVKKGETGELEEIIKNIEKTFKNELAESDGAVGVHLAKVGKPSNVLDKTSTNMIIDLILLVPNGPQTMSQNIKGLVQSSNNLGVIYIKDGEFVMENAIRSSIETLKLEILGRLKALANISGCEIQVGADYPGWEYKKDSYIREVFQTTWEKMYDKKAESIAIHAGLECGLFFGKLEGLDIIAVGPNLYDIHTPLEHFSISSSERFINFIIEALRNIKA